MESYRAMRAQTPLQLAGGAEYRVPMFQSTEGIESLSLCVWLWHDGNRNYSYISGVSALGEFLTSVRTGDSKRWFSLSFQTL